MKTLRSIVIGLVKMVIMIITIPICVPMMLADDFRLADWVQDLWKQDEP